ncbi:unnamed protein product, partial [Vitis vinifera]|uniref:Uncharacterized protein n=1 Tax=Vitis vinifera TaxID=29760 RepID=E0CTJ5_VITVI
MNRTIFYQFLCYNSNTFFVLFFSTTNLASASCVVIYLDSIVEVKYFFPKIRLVMDIGYLIC